MALTAGYAEVYPPTTYSTEGFSAVIRRVLIVASFAELMVATLAIVRAFS